MRTWARAIVAVICLGTAQLCASDLALLSLIDSSMHQQRAAWLSQWAYSNGEWLETTRDGCPMPPAWLTPQSLGQHRYTWADAAILCDRSAKVDGYTIRRRWYPENATPLQLNKLFRWQRALPAEVRLEYIRFILDKTADPGAYGAEKPVEFAQSAAVLRRDAAERSTARGQVCDLASATWYLARNISMIGGLDRAADLEVNFQIGKLSVEQFMDESHDNLLASIGMAVLAFAVLVRCLFLWKSWTSPKPVQASDARPAAPPPSRPAAAASATSPAANAGAPTPAGPSVVPTPAPAAPPAVRQSRVHWGGS